MSDQMQETHTSTEKIVVNKIDDSDQHGGGDEGETQESISHNSKSSFTNIQEGGKTDVDSGDEFMEDTEFGLEPMDNQIGGSSSNTSSNSQHGSGQNTQQQQTLNGGRQQQKQQTLNGDSQQRMNGGGKNNMTGGVNKPKGDGNRLFGNNDNNNNGGGNVINRDGGYGGDGEDGRDGRDDGVDMDRVVVDTDGEETMDGNKYRQTMTMVNRKRKAGAKTKKNKAGKPHSVNVMVPPGGRAVVPFKMPKTVDIDSLRNKLQSEYKALKGMSLDKRSQRMAELDATIFENPAADDFIKGLLPVLDDHALKLLALKSVMTTLYNK